MSKITDIVPRRNVHDLDPEFGKMVMDMLKGITWKKAIIGTVGFVAGFVICYILIAVALGF